jgi:copper(I)-binding protein
MTELRRWPMLAAMLLVLGTATVACGAGQVAQTAEHVTPRAGARVSEISVLDVAFLFRPPVAGDHVYGVGELAPLAVTIVNHGSTPDRLVRVGSPIATTGVVAEGLRIPGGQTLTAGQEGAVASLEVSYENDAGLIALAGLREPIRSGLTYPVIFSFERAGDVLVEVPVETPEIPRRDLTEEEERP